MKITIFGLAGSGTSTIGKMLCEHLWYDFMSTGNIFRSFAADAGIDLYTFENTIAKHDINFDKKLDAYAAEYGEKNNNFVFESRLAWYFIPDSFKIYLDCNKDERYRRIHNREWGNLDEIVTNNSRRESELELRYSQVYPEILFPPKKGNFDLYIDASSISPEEILSQINTALESWNFI